MHRNFQIGNYILLENVSIFYPFPEHPLFLVEEGNIVKISNPSKNFADLFW